MYGDSNYRASSISASPEAKKAQREANTNTRALNLEEDACDNAGDVGASIGILEGEGVVFEPHACVSSPRRPEWG